MTTMTITTQHIDEKKLYTDDKYRFEYVAAYMGFTSKDAEAIQGIADKMAPAVPVLVDAVYQKQFEFDVTKKHFWAKNEGFEGELAESLETLTLDHPQIKMRKNFLGKYLNRVLKGPYDDRFLNYLDWVAKIHTDTPEKKSKINVDYIHINALMGFVESAVVETVFTLDLPREQEKAVISAFNKLMWIQNDYYAKYYMNPYFSEVMQQHLNTQKQLQKPGDGSLYGQLNILSVMVGLVAGVVGAWLSSKC